MSPTLLMLPILVWQSEAGPLPELPPKSASMSRPAWAAEGVADTVWMLLESAATADDDDRREELLAEAEEHARAAAEGKETDVGLRFGVAVVLGVRANHGRARSRVSAASELAAELDEILSLDPNHPPARHLLGRLHAAVRRMGRVTRWIATNLLGGEDLKSASWEGAELHLAFAEEHAPEVADHHLQLANLYRDTGRLDLALEEVAHVLELTATSPMEVAVLNEAIGIQADLR